MATHPHDSFDDLPPDVLRVGAHRAPAKKGRGWFGVLWALLATILLIGIGIFGLAYVNGDLPFQQPEPLPVNTPTPSPTAEPVIDPAVPITILNGTPTPGLATVVGDALVAQGWDGAKLGVGSRANAATTDIEETVVYYSDPSFEGAARGLVLALGVGDIRLSNDYPNSDVTVVVGADYRPAP
jgi:hypothetical protein